MAKAAKKKSKAPKKSARVTTKPKAAAKSAKSAKPKPRKAAIPKIDPLNRKQYGPVTPNIIVADVRQAMNFYTSVFGFKAKQVMDSPQGIMHAELTFRDSNTTLMLSPESFEYKNLSARVIGDTPITLYILVDDVDAVFAKAVAAGGKVLAAVTDKFWGDRTGMIGDLDGNKWMVATHKSEPTEKEMAEALRQMLEAPPQANAAGAGD